MFGFSASWCAVVLLSDQVELPGTSVLLLSTPRGSAGVRCMSCWQTGVREISTQSRGGCDENRWSTIQVYTQNSWYCVLDMLYNVRIA